MPTVPKVQGESSHWNIEERETLVIQYRILAL